MKTKKILIILLTTLIFIATILTTKIIYIYPLYGYRIFEDWNYIYSYLNCTNEFYLFIPKYYNCIDLTLNKEFVYPKIWLTISKTLGKYFLDLIYLFIIIYVFAVLKFLKERLWLYFAFILSPTSILVVQRGNNELVIFSLIFLFGIMINSIKFRKLSFIPLLLTIKLKLFPIFLVIIYFLKKLILKNFYQPLIIIVICLFSINEFFIINKIYNKSNVTLAYSADTIFAIINYYFKINYLNIKLISFLALLLLITLSFSKKKTFVNNDKLNNKIFFLTGALILVPSFFLSNTYDYKFIFIIFCIPHILKINKIRNTFITLILMCIWIEFLIFYSRNYSNISNILSNNTLDLNYYSYLFILFTITKNIFYWIINYYLIVISKNILVIEIYKKKYK